MSSQFALLDVSAEFMMDVAKVVASSPHPLSREDLLRSFKKSRPYISNAVSQCVQLTLVSVRDGLYVSSERHRDLIKRSERSQLYLSLREALQRYPPFLLYIDFISKKYSSKESATMTRGIFRIESPEKVVEKSLRTWGVFAQLISKDKDNRLSIPEAEKGLPSEYVESLMKALRANLQAVNNGSDVVTIVLQGDKEQKDILPIQFISRDTTIFKSLKPLLTIYYTIIPEFPSFLILPLFMIATLLAVIVYKRKYSK